MNKSILLCLLMICSLSAKGQDQNVPVLLTTSSTVTGHGIEGNPQRSQIYIPSVYQDNYTLLFESCCIGSTIEIVQNGTVVYSSVITNEDGSVELPLYIIGECKLYLYWAGIMFEGELELLEN